MHFRLRDGVSFCWVDDRPIFLDLRTDRYFELTLHQAVLFRNAVLQGLEACDDARELQRTGLLVPTSDVAHPLAPATCAAARMSVMEMDDTNIELKLSEIFEVVALVLSTQRWLQNRRLGELLDDLAGSAVIARRQAFSSSPGHESPEIIKTSRAFLGARLYAPANTSCLLDTLALCRFLTRRGLPWTMVFGVTRYPFSAHCWAQAGELALNDTVGNVSAHTPIRVVL